MKKNNLLSLTLISAALLAGGCMPEEFIWWSPDGQTAAIRSKGGLRLAGTNGVLSEVVWPGEIQSVDWLPDGSLVVSRSIQLPNWAAVAEVLPPEEAAATLELSRAIPDLMKAGLKASGGTWENFEEKFLKPLGLGQSTLLESAWQCALSQNREELLAIAATAKDAAKMKAEILSQTNGIAVSDISRIWVSNGRLTNKTQTLTRSLHPFLDLSRSPRHPVVAFRNSHGELKVIALDGRTSLLVSDNVASAAWSSDGSSLFYVKKEENEIVGEIRARKVTNEKGELLKEAGPVETLAMAAFVTQGLPKLRTLPDGRILFSTIQITLPATSSTVGVQPRAQFHLLDPAAHDAGVTAVKINQGSLPEDLNAFAVSPDGKFVVVVEGGTDVVAVLDLSTGIVKIISPPHEGWKSRMIPSWRNARQLTFAASTAAKADRPELVLWEIDGPQRVLSKEWPNEVVQPWMESPNEKEKSPEK